MRQRTAAAAFRDSMPRSYNWVRLERRGPGGIAVLTVDRVLRCAIATSVAMPTVTVDVPASEVFDIGDDPWGPSPAHLTRPPVEKFRAATRVWPETSPKEMLIRRCDSQSKRPGRRRAERIARHFACDPIRTTRNVLERLKRMRSSPSLWPSPTRRRREQGWRIPRGREGFRRIGP